MNVKTIYGTINDDIIDSIEGKLKDFLEEHISAAELFFAEEADITNEDIDSNMLDDLFDFIADYKFDYPERVIALLDIIDKDLANIEQDDYGEGHIFLTDGGEEWMVLTDDEADEKTIESIENLLDDVGLFGLSDTITQTILNADNLIDDEWFQNYMNDSNVQLVDDMQEEDVNDEPKEGEYLNRLHKEAVKEGLMDEPEWPEKPEDEDSNEYSEWQAEMENLISETEMLIQDTKDDLVEKLNDDYDTGLEWYIDNFGEEQLMEVIEDQNLVDTREVAEYLFEYEFMYRGDELNRYDGVEYTADIKYRGRSYTFFIYRIL